MRLKGKLECLSISLDFYNLRLWLVDYNMSRPVALFIVDDMIKILGPFRVLVVLGTM